jgi:hypothetical protein
MPARFAMSSALSNSAYSAWRCFKTRAIRLRCASWLASQGTELPALLTARYAIDDFANRWRLEHAGIERAFQRLKEPDDHRHAQPLTHRGRRDAPPVWGDRRKGFVQLRSPSIVGSTLMATRSTGASGLASASHSAGSGTGKAR